MTTTVQYNDELMQSRKHHGLKNNERIKLQSDIDKFLQAGGTIKEIKPTDSRVDWGKKSYHGASLKPISEQMEERRKKLHQQRRKTL